MIFCLFIFNLILNICNAQEHLTCLRTNDVLRPQPTVSTGIQQGPPGKRGPIGLKGDTGSKGNKGDPGIPDQTSINELRGKVSIQYKFAEFVSRTLYENCLISLFLISLRFD